MRRACNAVVLHSPPGGGTESALHHVALIRGGQKRKRSPRLTLRVPTNKLKATLAELEGMLAALEADTTIRDALKPVVREKYEQAIESARKAVELNPSSKEAKAIYEMIQR